MRYSLFSLALLFSSIISSAQLTFPADGGNKKASVSEVIGLTNVTVHYDRPGVKGREGKIWGDVVHTGFAPNPGFGTATKLPWRAGANETTYMTFSTDVTIEGKKLPAGTYGFFIAYDPKECTLIFSKEHEGWGSYFYNENNDALRVNVKPQPTSESRERLTYSFDDQTDSSAVLSLYWEKLRIPFTVSTELTKLQLASIEREMNTEKGFYAASHYQVADYYLSHNIDLDKALQHITTASRSMPAFHVLSAKAEIEEKLGKTKEAAETMKKAIAATFSANQAHYYARQFVGTNNQKAFNVFKLNYDHYPNVFTTNMGMARGYSAIGNYKEALRYASKALPQAPDATNRTVVEKSIAALKEGKDISTL